MRLTLTSLLLLAALAGSSQLCNIDYLGANVSNCDPVTGNYEVSGTVEFSNEPSSGSLVVRDVISGQQVVFSSPFSSPQPYTITGIPGTGQFSDIETWFTADTTCSSELSYLSPTCQSCHAGTFSTNGQNIDSIILCYGDTLLLESHLNFSLPSGPAPGILYRAYSCQPDVANNDPMGDPCGVAYFAGAANDLMDVNDASAGIYGILDGAGVPLSDRSIWLAPVTFTDVSAMTYDPGCVDIGSSVRVIYLEELLVQDSVDNMGTLYVWAQGGYHGAFGGDYSFSINTGGASSNMFGVGDTVIVSGLAPGASYTYSVGDSAGCSVEVMGTYPVSVADLSSQLDVKVWPNPSDRRLFYESAERIEEVRIHDLMGRVLYRQKGDDQNSGVIDHELSSGSYYLLIDFSDGVSRSLPIIIQ